MTNTRTKILAIAEGAVMVAMAWVVDFLCSLIPYDAILPFGGSISLGMVPIIYYSYRRGWKWGLGAGLVFAGIQMLMSLSVPPANTIGALILCILLDYVLAYAVIGLSDLFAKFFGHRLVLGYAMGAAIVCLIRMVFSILSGAILWGSSAPEGMNVWVYTLVYNMSYMIPNAILSAVALSLLTPLIDPHTLRPMKRKGA